jgi:hypothetical protein
MLVTLFDSVYGEEEAKTLTYEEFKARYVHSIQLSNRLIKESFAVTQLQRIIEDKDYDEINNLFSYYIVEREEDELLSSLPNYTATKLEELRNTPVESFKLDEENAEHLKNLRERKMALRSLLSE